MRTIPTVIKELENLAAELELRADESGDFNEDYYYRRRAEIVRDAVEYLWQYGDLHE